MAGKGYRKQILLVGAFFFIFGFITWVNGTLIPYLRIACELKEWQAYLVTFLRFIIISLAENNPVYEEDPGIHVPAADGDHGIRTGKG